MRIVTTTYDHPDVQALVAKVQAEYAELYGAPDEGQIDAGQFVPPAGLFALGYVGDRPVAMVGWRRHDANCVELKRMYVDPACRGNGYARALLSWAETTAAARGFRRLILETGDLQPAAVALYRSSGYVDVPAFGHYADEPGSIHLGTELKPAHGLVRS